MTQNVFKISHPQKLVPKKNLFFKTKHASEFGKALDAGKLLENIEVPLPLGDLKALHASWVVKLHDFLTIERGPEIIKNGCKASAICQR